MHKLAIAAGTVLCLHNPGASAAWVQRCENSQGEITFTHLGCAEGDHVSQQRAWHPYIDRHANPSSRAQAMPQLPGLSITEPGKISTQEE